MLSYVLVPSYRFRALAADAESIEASVRSTATELEDTAQQLRAMLANKAIADTADVGTSSDNSVPGEEFATAALINMQVMRQMK